MSDLTQLAAEAAALDAQQAAAIAPPPGAQDNAPAVADPLVEAKALIDFIVFLFVPFWPSLEKVFTEQRKPMLAGSLVPLFEKYGYTMSGFFEKWGPEINALIIWGPVVIEARAAIKADNAARKAAAAAPEPGPTGVQE